MAAKKTKKQSAKKPVTKRASQDAEKTATKSAPPNAAKKPSTRAVETASKKTNEKAAKKLAPSAKSAGGRRATEPKRTATNIVKPGKNSAPQGDATHAAPTAGEIETARSKLQGALEQLRAGMEARAVAPRGVVAIVAASAAEIDARLHGWVDPARPGAVERTSFVNPITGERVVRDVPLAPRASDCAPALDPAGLPIVRWVDANIEVVAGFAEDLGAHDFDLLAPELETDARIGPAGSGRLGRFPDEVTVGLASATDDAIASAIRIANERAGAQHNRAATRIPELVEIARRASESRCGLWVWSLEPPRGRR